MTRYLTLEDLLHTKPPPCSQDEVVELVVSVADGSLADLGKIAEHSAAWGG